MSKQEKSANKKALPKFIGIILVAAILGGIIGGIFAFIGGTMMPNNIVTHIHQFFITTTPFCIWGILILLTIISALLYHRVKETFQQWDGEDETIITHVEEGLSHILLLTILAMILNFFFFGTASLLSAHTGISVCGFILSIIAIIIIQQKTVDFIRKINPEKQGSVYDIHFQKKWTASLDEYERRQMGQAAFKAFNAVNNTCIGLWLFLILLSMMMPVGLLPMALVIGI